MSYTPYLISNYATGYDRQLQPWLLPDDAFIELLDGYVYKGVTNKRDGYSGFANGLKSTYTESRMVHSITFGYTVTGDIDGVNDAYTIQLVPPVIPGSITITGSNPVQVVTDDGVGGLIGDGTGTVNYVTGAISLTFTAPPAVASTITVTYGNFAVGDGTVGPYTNTLSNIPLSRGSVTITAGAQSFTDNGLGYFLFPSINITGVALTNPASITTAINHGYTTGDQVVISSVGGTTEVNSIIAYTITVTSLNTFTLDGVDATGFTPYTSDGTSQKVAGTVNYTTGQISITFGSVVPIGTAITITSDYFPGLPVMGVMNFYPMDNVRQLIVADTRFVNRYNPSTDRLEDLPAGTYTGTDRDFWSWVNYEDANSLPRLLFSNGRINDVIQQYDGTVITNYAPTFAIGTLNARQIFNFKDRLILFQTVEAGVLYPRRIRISGTGTQCDVFDTTATGAGFIDIPDNTWFFGAAFNRDDLMFFTQSSAWTMKYTGNDVTPFVLQKIDGSRGSFAAFSVISYLNRTMAASPRGLIISDGYQVDRMDETIPRFSFNDINGTNFDKCFSGFIDEDRDVYLIYPSKGVVKPPLVPPNSSDRILVTNFEENNYAIYRIPLSCMGNFEISFNLLWSDLTIPNGFPNWDALDEKFGNWDAFPYEKATPISIGGGHKGEIWRLNDTQSQDNPQKIRAITILNDQRIRVTTDWNNYEVGDFIVFEAVEGMVEINHKQGQIVNIQTNYTVFDVDFGQSHGGFSTYTSGGIASRCIPLEAISKKLNPWIDSDKKVRCGWIYFYVSVSDTILTDWDEAATPVPALLKIDVLTNNNEDPDFSNPQFTYLIDCSPINNEKGNKKWVKIWINQVGQFLQFKMSNNQAGASIQVHAMMPGFQPLGRIV